MRHMKKKWTCLVLVGMFFCLTGCSKQELEKSSYPMAILLDCAEDEQLSVTFLFPDLAEKADQKTEKKEAAMVMIEASDLYGAIKTWKQDQDHTLDCNHVKALILGSDFLKNTSQVEKLLQYIKKEDVLARNVLLFESDDCEALKEQTNGLTTSLGEYLEGMVENQTEMKATAAITLGTLLNQMYNQNETIFLPVLRAKEKGIFIDAYRTIQRFYPGELLTTEQQQVVSLLNDQRKKFSYRMPDGSAFELRHIRLRYQMDEKQDTLKQHLLLTADAVSMSKELPVGKKLKRECTVAESTVRTMLIRVTKELKASDIEPTNSFLRLGAKNRAAYKKYKDRPAEYEKEVDTSYEVRLALVR